MARGVQDEIERLEREIERNAAALAAVRALGGVEGARWVYAAAYGSKPQIDVDPASGVEPLEIVTSLMGRLHIRLARKTFNESDGTVKFEIDAPFAEITVRGKPPARCEVIKEEVEEMVPARLEKRVKYRLADPGCLGAANGSGAQEKVVDRTTTTTYKGTVGGGA